MNIKIIQRRYPDTKWDYKAVSTIFGNKEIFYYTLKSKNKFSKGVETYSGSNYVQPFFVKGKSYSRHYTLTNIPSNYKMIISELIKFHNKVKWSNAKYVDHN